MMLRRVQLRLRRVGHAADGLAFVRDGYPGCRRASAHGQIKRCARCSLADLLEGPKVRKSLGHALHPVTITVVSPPSPVLCIAAVRVYGIADCASSPIDRNAAVRLQCVSFAPFAPGSQASGEGHEPGAHVIPGTVSLSELSAIAFMQGSRRRRCGRPPRDPRPRRRDQEP
jgi:hypothetical protein